MSYFESACTNHIKQQIDFDSSPLIRHSSRQSSVTTLSHVVDIYKPSPVQCSQHSSQEFVSERQALLDSLEKSQRKKNNLRLKCIDFTHTVFQITFPEIASKPVPEEW